MSSPRSTPRIRTEALLDLLRKQLGAEGRVPSRVKLSALIVAGAARVDGRCVRDPAARVEAGARVSFDPADLSPEDGGDPPALLRTPRSRVPRSMARVPLPQGVLFADAQLVVIERARFAAADGPLLAAEVAALLARTALHPVRDPSAPGGGPVLLAGSQAARRHLEDDLREGRLRETLLSLRTPPQAGPGEAVLELGGTQERGRSLAFALLRREEAPPAPPPLGARDLVPAQRLALVLKHPRTNRRLAFEVEPSALFLAACVRLGVSGGAGG